MKNKKLFWIMNLLLLIITMSGVIADNYISADSYNRSDRSLSGEDDEKGLSYVLPRVSTITFSDIVSNETNTDSGTVGYAVPIDTEDLWTWKLCTDSGDDNVYMGSSDNTQSEGLFSSFYCTYTANVFKCFSGGWTELTGITGYTQYLFKGEVTESADIINLYAYGMTTCEDSTPSLLGNKTFMFRNSVTSNYWGVHGSTAGSKVDYHYIWNGSIGDENSSQPPQPVNFTLSAKDSQNQIINNFTGEVNGTFYYTTNGLLNTNILIGESIIDFSIQDAINDSSIRFANATFLNIKVNESYNATLSVYVAPPDYSIFPSLEKNYLNYLIVFSVLALMVIMYIFSYITSLEGLKTLTSLIIMIIGFFLLFANWGMIIALSILFLGLLLIFIPVKY